MIFYIMSDNWVEKYRPSNLDEVSAQTNVVKSLKASLQTKNIPHLIFFGPSGCGKTSTILALAKELFGVDNYRDRIIELNASDERGIDVVRKTIKNFARTLAFNADFKIIFLDESDALTADAQQAG